MEEIKEEDILITADHYIDKDVIDKDFVFCSICTNILNNPINLDCCRHMFCKDCVDKWNHRECSICKQIFSINCKNKYYMI